MINNGIRSLNPMKFYATSQTMKYLQIILVGCLLLGCEGGIPSPLSEESGLPPVRIEKTTLENGEPSHVSIQHILISFEGALPGGSKLIRRNQDGAQRLANEVLERAKSGEDFDALVEEFTDDSPPGIYNMANYDQKVFMEGKDQSSWVRPRTGLVKGFGNVGFSLEVDEIGMAEYQPSESPFGWHIIKRLK
jgi:hypothetical protein